MKQYRFIIVGSGWRSLYYVRIAKALSSKLKLEAMLCRSNEKAEMISNTHHIPTSTSIEECMSLKPDFVVVAVDKSHIAEVSMEWLEKGFPVLCETPAALDLETLNKLWKMHTKGHKLIVAEQYTHYPINIVRKKILDRKLISDPDYLYLSLAHEYHGISLIRSFLDLDIDTPFSISGQSFLFPTVETLSRYERFTDGKIASKKRDLALFTFENKKVCLYDFDSEQYRSPIRNDSYKIQGSNGEILNDTLTYLNNNETVKDSIVIKSHFADNDDTNPNLNHYEVIDQISYKDEILYSSPFTDCELSSDETAIAMMLLEMGEYVSGGKEPYPLSEALQDAYMAILLRQALKDNKKVISEKMIWQNN